jgi:hypothetical protein
LHETSREHDPATGEIEVFDDPDGRGPYGIAATPAGDIWYASLACFSAPAVCSWTSTDRFVPCSLKGWLHRLHRISSMLSEAIAHQFRSRSMPFRTHSVSFDTPEP